MKVITDRHGDTRILQLDGESLDAAAARALREPLLAEAESGPVILDLGAVQFADTAGLGLLCAMGAGAFPRQVILIGVSPRLSQCFRRIPADRLPMQLSSRVEALAALHQRSHCTPQAKAPAEVAQSI
ncbi:MAG: STAS domain-containing protein [Gemmataceae bacterium]